MALTLTQPLPKDIISFKNYGCMQLIYCTNEYAKEEKEGTTILAISLDIINDYVTKW